MLLKKYIQFPMDEQLVHGVNGFRLKCGIIHCGSAMDGCHIPVKPPALNHTDYCNRKGWYLVVLHTS